MDAMNISDTLFPHDHTTHSIRQDEKCKAFKKMIFYVYIINPPLTITLNQEEKVPERNFCRI